METMLVVENDINQAQLYKQELEEEGYEVLLAHGEQEALKKIQDHKFDLVILDINLSEVDGVEVLSQIIRLKNNMPVIIYTAYDHLKNDFMTRAVKHYITKSSDLSELKVKIREVLGQRGK